MCTIYNCFHQEIYKIISINNINKFDELYNTYPDLEKIIDLNNIIKYTIKNNLFDFFIYIINNLNINVHNLNDEYIKLAAIYNNKKMVEQLKTS